MLTHGSLFAGVGGFDLGFSRVGIQTIWQVENDPYCLKVLERHWPDVKRYGDVERIERLEGCDILTAGFPCQDLSVAGKRAGLAGARSGLFWEIIRLASELRPEWLLLENVPGLRTSGEGKDYYIIVAALTELGYCVAGGPLNSRYFGVPQSRPRMFFVGNLGKFGSVEILFEPKSVSRHLKTSGKKRKGNQAGCLAARNKGGGGLGTDFEIDGGLTVSYAVRSNPLHSCDKGDGGINQTLIAHALRSEGADASEDGTGRGTPIVAAKVGVRRLTPRECERLQGFPDDWTRWDAEGNEISDSPRYRMLGNAVTVNVAQWLAKRILEFEKSRVY